MESRAIENVDNGEVTVYAQEDVRVAKDQCLLPSFHDSFQM